MQLKEYTSVKRADVCTPALLYFYTPLLLYSHLTYSRLMYSTSFFTSFAYAGFVLIKVKIPLRRVGNILPLM